MKKVFDYVVIIVADQFQKKFLERKLLERKEKLFNGTKYKIEIEKEKVGSGGALIKLVRQIKKDGKKILVINSAGKSSRMPLYADKGKICIPTFSGKNTILFDEILEETINIGENMNSGILVVSGDCTINYKEVNNKVFKENKVFSVLTDAKIGERHGVFLTDNNAKVKNSLQKEKENVLREKGAIDKDNKVNIDTGMIYFNETMIEKLKKIDIDSNVIIDLYTDIMYPLCLEANLNKYLFQKSEMKINEKLVNSRKKIWKAISDETLELEKLKSGKFVHYGTTKEFLEIAFKKNNKTNIVLDSNVKGDLTKRCYIENSTILESAKIGENSVIIDSIVGCSIPKNLIVKTLEENGKYYVEIYNLKDNSRCILGNKIHLLENDKERACSKAMKIYNQKYATIKAKD